MSPLNIDHSWYARAWLIVAHALSVVAARCSLLLQQASDDSPSFR